MASGRANEFMGILLTVQITQNNAMRKKHPNQLASIRQVSRFLAQHRLNILKLSGNQDVISRFQIQASGLFILYQHREIIIKGISTDFLEMKLSLCRHVYEITEFLYTASTANDEIRATIKKHPGVNQLSNSRDHHLIKHCTEIFKVADRYRHLFSNARIDPKFIDSLKSATEMYNAVIPPPRTVLLLEKALSSQIRQIEKKLTGMMDNELNELMLQAGRKSSTLLSKYQLSRNDE